MSAKAFAYDFEVDGIYDFEVDGIYYNVLSDTTCEVTKENLNYEYDGDIIIPEQVTYRRKTMRVTAIGGAAFSHNTGLTSVEIPNSVTTLALTHLVAVQALQVLISLIPLRISTGQRLLNAQALQVLRFPIPLNISTMERFMNAPALQVSL